MGGKFIVLEGIDGAGTTTQARRLQERKGWGSPVYLEAEPSHGPVGQLIRKYLGKEMEPISPKAMELLFRADRLDHSINIIQPALEWNMHVICDRYYASTLAYQSAVYWQAHHAEAGYLGSTQHMMAKIMWDLHCDMSGKEEGQMLAEPDVTLLLGIDPSIATARVKARSEKKEIYDELELQKWIAKFYKIWLEDDRYTGDKRWISADQRIEVVTDLCWEVVRNIL